MAKKILNLQLNYKGKYLDTVRHERDFNSSFYLGKNKHLFWQIDDKKFPGKYKFLAKTGSKFKLFLQEGMQVKVNKNGRELSKEELKKENLLQGNALVLDAASEGIIEFPNDWSVQYFFKEPYKLVPKQEHLAIHKQFAKTPKPSDEERFTRIFIILGLLITAIGLFIGELTYVPPEEISFSERFQRIQDTATRVETDVVPEVAEVEEPVQTRKQESEEEAQQVVEEAAEMTSAEFAAEFGLEFGGLEGGEGTDSFEGELLEVTQVGEIVASGPGDGASSKVKRGAGELDMAGGGFDLDSAEEGLGGLGGLDGLDLGGSGGFEEVDMASLGGDIANYKTTKVTSKAQFQEIRKKYAGIKMVQEGSIELQEQSAAEKTEFANIQQIVNAYKPQITKLFTSETMMMDMYGTLKFNLIIDSNNSVEAVDIEVAEGSYFSDSFLQKAKQIIMNWTIKVEKPVGYSFSMTFYK
ncbi:MAG: hypothetical protein R6U84_02700 [Candidatus Cloacimonadales bacterium]